MFGFYDRDIIKNKVTIFQTDIKEKRNATLQVKCRI